mmetsp:Transcript_24567/g.92845  ORF Transcript_24567/g.92845 Transcript_24567/m.92845 type:complete len:225 (+) Transcript_24567:999-1673(+)
MPPWPAAGQGCDSAAAAAASSAALAPAASSAERRRPTCLRLRCDAMDAAVLPEDSFVSASARDGAWHVPWLARPPRHGGTVPDPGIGRPGMTSTSMCEMGMLGGSRGAAGRYWSPAAVATTPSERRWPRSRSCTRLTTDWKPNSLRPRICASVGCEANAMSLVSFTKAASGSGGNAAEGLVARLRSFLASSPHWSKTVQVRSLPMCSSFRNACGTVLEPVSAMH